MKTFKYQKKGSEQKDEWIECETMKKEKGNSF